MALKIGIIGARGIGYTHARHYNELGADIAAVLCSSELSAKTVADNLKKIYDKKVSYYHNLDDFLSEDLDAVSICSPPEKHFDHISACFEKNIPVFCEKPLFWNKSFTLPKINHQISFIKQHKNRRLFVNTSNTIFIDTIMKIEDKLLNCKNLSFEFFTNGNYKGIDIAKDLMPHGISLLIHRMGNCAVDNFTFESTKHSFFCKFSYGKCEVNFDFRQNPEGPKHMRIISNNNSYTRIQTGNHSSYKVSLINDKTKEIINIKDPFRVFIERFLDYVNSSGVKEEDGFDIGSLNLKIMSKCLIHC